MFEDDMLAPDIDFARRELSLTPDFSWARRRIRSCAKDHKACSTTDNPPVLPTRVLSVGHYGQTKQPRVILSAGMKCDYVALSHCWGHSPVLKSTKANLGGHLRGIRMDDLPRTFRHAVVTTRNLGYQYLWIDSLCIVQDDPEDWGRECVKMSDIYKNAAVTIGGLRAANSYDGFLDDRPCIYPPIHVWEYKSPHHEVPRRATLRRSDRKLQSRDRRFWGSKTWDDLLSTSDIEGTPLQKRAWVLQERLLSRRNLYFSDWRMIFECNTCVCLEDRMHYEEKSILSQGEEKQFIKQDYAQGAQEQDAKMWYKLVQLYTRRYLTVPTDTLIAISGMARDFWPGTLRKHDAGLLYNDIPGSLAWYVDDREFIRFRVPNSGHSLAPSWSWASSCHSISYHPLSQEYHVPSDRTKTTYSDWRAQISRNLELKVLDPGTNHDPKNLSRRVAGEPLMIEGRVRALDPNLDAWGYSFYPDNPWRPFSEYRTRILCVAVGSFGDGWGALVIEPARPEQVPEGWLVQPPKDKDAGNRTFENRTWSMTIPSWEENIRVDGITFRRVGYWQCRLDKEFKSPGCNPFFNAPLRRLILV